MDTPLMAEPIRITDDTQALAAYLPIPGLGTLAINAYLIQARQPMLVDTGMAALRSDFMARLRSLIDPAALRWIWITHTDADHVGNLAELLDEAPDARVITTFLGMGKMNLLGLPTGRVYLLNPGQQMDLGDRTVMAVRPPSYDAPETTGLFDFRTGALFSADSFGALLSGPADRAADISSQTLRDGLVTWAGIDAPWLHQVPRTTLDRSLNALRELQPEWILSSHLPAARGLQRIYVQACRRRLKRHPSVGRTRRLWMRCWVPRRLPDYIVKGVITMTVERNKTVVRCFLEGTHNGRLDVIDQTVAEDVVTHGMFGLDPNSRESYRHFFEVIEATFHEMVFEIEAMVAEADKVAVRFTVSALHRGPFMGIAASGKQVSFSGMVIYRLRAERIVETWLYPDNLSLLKQLGVMAA